MDWTSAAATSLLTYYPNFHPTGVPGITGARHAWKGTLRPLARICELHQILADLNVGNVVRVLDEGVLHHDPACSTTHDTPWYAPRLHDMDAAFTVVLVERGLRRHPQVFSIHPMINARHYPTHPHLRRDQVALIEDQLVDSLCTYLASDDVMCRDEMTLVHALDYTSMFFAKHLVWLRTSTLIHYQPFVAPRPLAIDPSGIGLHFPVTSTVNGQLRWEGHWIGPQAPHQAHQLLATINLDDECPCGTGDTYAYCCRNDHLAFARAANAAMIVGLPINQLCMSSLGRQK